MDLILTGEFLRELRKEKGYTQEQLGELLGVTNKTVSRWETGNYMPPVEILQRLSELYGITINEILAGKRLSDDEYKKKADENIITALDGSVFSMKDKRKFYWKEWMKKYAWALALYLAAVIALAVVGIFIEGYNEKLLPLELILCLAGTALINERRTIYVEKRVYEDKLAQLGERYGVKIEEESPEDN